MWRCMRSVGYLLCLLSKYRSPAVYILVHIVWIICVEVYEVSGISVVSAFKVQVACSLYTSAHCLNYLCGGVWGQWDICCVCFQSTGCLQFMYTAHCPDIELSVLRCTRSGCLLSKYPPTVYIETAPVPRSSACRKAVRLQRACSCRQLTSFIPSG